ncbi:MAG TPA: IclR family transcriptional regulator [Actinomycetota bacterium]|nr:IclR family transcriptional regulator [Actinomycetota bacterium]
MPAEYQIRSVTRALQVLIAVSELGEADLSTVARTVGLHPTTTLRMLESLRSRDLVRQRRGLYEIGARAFEIGCSFVNRKPLAQEAQALVDELARRVNETASFGILDDGEVLYLAIAPGERELGIQSTAGGRHPAYCTALGKALIAYLPWEAVESILQEHPPVRLTSSTVVDPAQLRQELAQVVRQGFAIDAEERVPGVVCVAAPIRDQTGGVVAAISISGPEIRLTKRRIPSLAQHVRKIADEASGILGAPEKVLESRV